MRISGRRVLPIVAGLVVTAASGLGYFSSMPRGANAQQKAEADWKPVEEALGKSGQVQAGDVYRVAMPRTDLKVKVQGVDVKAGFALGSYAAFKKMGNCDDYQSPSSECSTRDGTMRYVTVTGAQRSLGICSPNQQG
jgi:hypothetical protein